MTAPQAGDPADATRSGLPDGVDPLGVPRPGGAHDAFVITAAVVVALLALAFTLGWIVYHQIAFG